MKKLISLFLSLSLIATQSFADSAGDLAGAILVTFGVAKGFESINVYSLQQMELEEWKDQASNSTTEMGAQCGLYYEAHLIGDVSVNYLWLALKNKNKEQVVFNPIDADFRFSNGMVRKPDLFRFNEVFFESERMYNMLLPFPSKEDFLQEKQVEITLPVRQGDKPCQVKIIMLRNPQIADTLRSTISMDRVDIEVGLGKSAFSGGLAKTLKEKQVGSMNFNVDFYGPSGGGMYLGFRSHSDIEMAAPAANNEGLTGPHDIRVSESHIGYVHRYFLNRDNQLHWRLGLSGLNYNIWNELERKDSYSNSGVDAQVYYQHYFARNKAGIWRGNYYWAANLSLGSYSYKKELKGGDFIDANITSGYLVIGVGN